jgi:hypothetical protein
MTRTHKRFRQRRRLDTAADDRLDDFPEFRRVRGR